MKKLALIAALACTLLLSLPVFAELEVSGSIESGMTLQIDEDTCSNVLTEQLQLNLYLPVYDYSSATANLVASYNSLTGTVDFGFSKLYLRGSFEHFNFKAGRQPLGWNFGSMVNPIDYNLSSVNFVDLNGEEGSVDAITGTYYVGTLSNVSAVCSVLDPQHLKWAVRGRTNVAGFDLMANYVQEDAETRRIGLAFKGDLFAEFYGGASYRFTGDIEDGKAVYMVGTDYSFDDGNDQKIVIQLEYLKDDTGSIQLPVFDNELLLLNVTYPVDEFSNVNLAYVRNLQDKSQVILGKYSVQFDDGLDINATAMLFKGEDGGQFTPGTLGMVPEGVISIVCTYSF